MPADPTIALDHATRNGQAEALAPLLVDSHAAARLLCVSLRTLWARSAPRGPIPVVRVGRAVRYRPADLAAWVQAQT